jgi:hypothetical protein
MRRRLASILVLAAAAVTTTVAFASGLGPLGVDAVGAASAGIARCDPDGFTIVSYTTSGGDVTQAVVGGIAEPACAGGQLSLTLTDAGGAAIGSGGPVAVPSAADPGSAAVPLTVQPYAGDVAGFHAVVVGP